MTEPASVDGEGESAEDLSGPRSAPAPKVLGRHRRHQFPAREHAVKVLYAAGERRKVELAAELRGLRPSSFVAEAALERAEQLLGEASDDHPGVRTGRTAIHADGAELMAELIQARLVLRRFGVNLNQAVAAMNSGAAAPVWFQRAVDGGHRAVARVDEAAAAVARRFG
jgi:hypothetical protein